MSNDEKLQELIRLLGGGRARREDVRLRRWREAFQEWLRERKANFSKNVGEDSQHAWEEFLSFVKKPPWEVKKEDVESYFAWLQKKGLSTETIWKRRTGLSKFYQYCEEKGIEGGEGGVFNPVKMTKPPKGGSYEKANYLERLEEAALLEAMRRDSSTLAKRDLAFFLALLKTGRTAGEIRKLRWEDLEILPKGTWMVSRRNGVERRVRLPAGVWRAMLVYLKRAGRLEKMKEGDYVFAPSKEPLRREAGNRAEDWDSSRPLSMDQVHYLLKLYCDWAGLKGEAITFHTLRHTAAMRKAEAGEEAQAIQKFLGRSSLENTQKYLKRLKRGKRRSLRWRKRQRWKKGQAPSRGPCRLQPGNHMALKHGFYARRLPELEELDREGVELEGWKREIMRYRIVALRAFTLSDYVETWEETVNMFLIAVAAAMRVGKAMEMDRKEWLDGLYGLMGEDEEGDGDVGSVGDEEEGR